MGGHGPEVRGSEKNANPVAMCGGCWVGYRGMTWASLSCQERLCLTWEPGGPNQWGHVGYSERQREASSPCVPCWFARAHSKVPRAW